MNRRGLTDLGYKIFLDRYSQKDTNRTTLKPGDLVLVKVDNNTGQKEVGYLGAFASDAHGTDNHAYVQLGNDSVMTIPKYPVEAIDKPLELDPAEMWERVARTMAEPERDDGGYDEWYEKFRWLLEDWKFLPGGRILAGAGTDTELSYYNCYVLPSPIDSKQGIFITLNQMAQIMARGGGVGINISTLRPRYAYAKATNGRSSGAVSWGELYSYTTGLIEQGGSRRGALMLILNDWHPDVLEFISVKRDMKRIINANISVGISDEFMQAVKEDREWLLKFPDTTYPNYKKLWHGDLKAWEDSGYPVKIWKTLKARELWDAIVESAWACAEPGIWFKGRSNQYSNSWYYAPLIATNPCITGDTLIAVADGRNAVSIKQLAEEGKSVPVYCYDKVKGITTSMGHHPRLTRFQAPVYKITLDDGTTIKATEDHRFMLRDGSYKTVKELTKNESLMPFSKRFDNKGHVIVRGVKSMKGVRQGEDQEHRIFAELKLGRKLKPYPEEIVHHDDNNPANNDWNNLIVMTHAEHSSLTLSGPNNPMIKWFNEVSEERREEFRRKMSAATAGPLNGNYGKGTPLGGKIKYRNAAIRHACKLINAIGYIPHDEWDMHRTPNIPHAEVLPNLFNNYDELWEEALAYNHKVESIEFCGYENVYNITVDNQHNYAVLTSERSGIVIANCSEQPLDEWSVCLLGSINLSKFVVPVTGERHWKVCWSDLSKAVGYAVRFLDNIIEATPYVYDDIRNKQQSERRIGLGTMGLAEVLIRLKLRYGSPESLKFIDELYQFIAVTAYETSIELAKEKGPFPQFKPEMLDSKFMHGMPQSIRDRILEHGIRNVTLLTQAPTGTIGTMVNTSTGIEPFYYWEFERKGQLGSHTERVKVYDEYLDSVALASKVDHAPLPNYFVTAMDLQPEEHVKVQAAIQRWVDSSISKTCNVPADYTVEQIGKLYELMYELGCKGGTVYRDTSRNVQVLNLPKAEANQLESPNNADIGHASTELAIRNRPVTMLGKTYKKVTPVGTAFITINHDDTGQPFETFINIGKAGSDVACDAEAIGRLVSMAFRASNGNIKSCVTEVVAQLKGIGGKSIGFGANRVSSVADALAQVLEQEYLAEAVLPGYDPHTTTYYNKEGELCPSCGNASIMRIEGCSKCMLCGYSAC